jgi:hypothetical protein
MSSSVVIPEFENIPKYVYVSSEAYRDAPGND